MMSMKPGQTTLSAASTISGASSETGGATVAIRSPATPTSARVQGLPEPSITRYRRG